MRDQWEREVRKELQGIASAMSEALGVGVKFQLDERWLAADRAVPKFTVPSRLQDYLPSQSTSMSPSRTRRAGQIRIGTIAQIGKLWREQRNEQPVLWSFVAWAQDQHERAPDTRALSSSDFASRMRTKRELRDLEEATKAPACGPDGGR